MSTILIIDDDEAIGNLEQEVLERAGYEVQRAFSGTEALLLLKQQRPDMILLDLMLPGISGEELLPQIQNIPVIVVSAKTGVDDKVGLLIQNPGQVIAKSVLLDRISLDTPDCTENSLKTHISHLRGKLREISGKEYVESVWGIGFRWKSGFVCEKPINKRMLICIACGNGSIEYRIELSKTRRQRLC